MRAQQIEGYLDGVVRKHCGDMAPAARDRWLAGPEGPVNKRDDLGFGPLHVAAVAGNYRAVEVLVKRGALLESVTMPQGWRALHLAASAGSAKARSMAAAMAAGGAFAGAASPRGQGSAGSRGAAPGGVLSGAESNLGSGEVLGGHAQRGRVAHEHG